MSDFIFNLSNPPKQFLPGQIWKSASTNKDFVLTDTKYSSFQIVRGMVVSPIDSAGDQNDVILDGLRFYPGNRVVFRLTASPIPVTDLAFYVGSIAEPDIIKVIESEKNKETSSYNELQLATINEIIDDITPLRMQAVELFEKQIAEKEQHSFNIICLSEVIPISEERFVYKNAAQTKIDSIDEFWKLEREAKVNSVVLKNDNEAIIRISIVNQHLYLIIYSKEYKKLNSAILLGDSKITALDSEIDIEESKRCFTSFEENLIKAGNYTLELILDNKQLLFDLRIS